MTDVPRDSSPAAPESSLEKPKRGRPSTGAARSRATIQREYRQRQKSNVTKNTVEAIDENMALREQLIALMDELEAVKARVRVEYELGEKARARVMQLEKQLAAQSNGKSEKAFVGPRFVLQFFTDQRDWTALEDSSGNVWEFKTQKEARRFLATQGRRGDTNWRIFDNKTGKYLGLE